MPKPERWFGRGAEAFWRGGRTAFEPVVRRLWKRQVTGPVPKPPYVLAANHFSHLDVVLIGQVVGPVRYLAVDELFGNVGWFDRLIGFFGAIPLSRTRAPLGAMREALATLERGMPVGMFPEGRRVWTWGETTPHRGAAWLSLRARVPIVPVAIWGTQESMGRGARWFRPWAVRMEIGEPIYPEDFAGQPEPAAAMMDAWHEWMDDAIERLRVAPPDLPR